MTNLDDGFGDWRIRAASRLASPLPAAFPGGAVHDAGAPVHLASQMKGPHGRPISFVTPSITALALSASMRAADEAGALRSALSRRMMATPQGAGEGIEDEGALYDCFERCITAVTFAFQSLEAYANEQITELVRTPYVLVRKKKRLTLDAQGLERTASTEEKLAVVLPDLLRVPTPKGKVVWERFNALKRLRDSAVHTKGADQYRRPTADQALDDSSLLYRFLHDDIRLYPAHAIRVLEYFGAGRLRWMTVPTQFALRADANSE